MSDPTPPTGQSPESQAPAQSPSPPSPAPAQEPVQQTEQPQVAQGGPAQEATPAPQAADGAAPPMPTEEAAPDLADQAPPQAAAPAEAPADPQSPSQPGQADATSTGEQAGQAPGQAAEPSAPQEPVQREPTVVVRYGVMRHVGEFHYGLETPLRPGADVVIRTERGVELGRVLTGVCESACPGCISHSHLKDFLTSNGPEYPFHRGGKILRLANPQDIIDQRHLDSSAVEERTFCRQQIREMGLQMKAICVEHLLGGERIIFYFTAESRVDFRELVRRMAGQYRTRIEMRQVGARDEARLVADYERCGQQCCCQGYLKDLKPVSMRMAKVQKATLDPAKISGRCGRLMCCLRYEDATYEDLRKRLPTRNSWVRTEKLVGKVIETQILTQLVRLALPDNTLAVVANEEILERNLAPPALPAAPAEAAAREPLRPSRPLRDEAPEAAADQPAGPGEEESPLAAQEMPVAEAEEDAPEAAELRQGPQAPDAGRGGLGQEGPGGQGRRKRRRRRRRGPGERPSPGQGPVPQAGQAAGGGPLPTSASPSGGAGPGPAQGQGQGSGRRHRRRRHRR